MPVADFEIFREQLAIKYPAHGHALWEPRPWRPYRPVEVGDVGFIRNGRFHSLFNALRPAEEQSSVPEDYEQLVPTFSDHITESPLSSNHYCSSGISVEPESEYYATGPGDFRQVSFKHPRRRGGAVLSLPVMARREDTLARGDFGAWMVKHIDHWFAFARGLGLGIEKMEEIILVTGCDHTRSWANVAFLGDEHEAQVTFGVKVVHDPAISIEWHGLPEHVQGAVLHLGPHGMNPPEDQCVFVRGFRVARTFGILPKHLKAAAGPSSDTGGYDYYEPDTEVVSIPATPNIKYRDPLYILLDYIVERAPNCNMFLIHDDDLELIDGIGDSHLLETLQLHLIMDIIRRSNIEIHIFQCDLSHTSSNPNSNTEVVGVAMFSPQNWQEDWTQSMGLFHASESSTSPWYSKLLRSSSHHAQTSKPNGQRFLCPSKGCGKSFNRHQEWDRHMLSLHLPDYLYCPYRTCPWRGHGEDARKRHIERGNCGPTPESREQYMIYDPFFLVHSIRDSGISLENAQALALTLVQAKVVELGKEDLWGNWWHYGGKKVDLGV